MIHQLLKDYLAFFDSSKSRRLAVELKATRSCIKDLLVLGRLHGTKSQSTYGAEVAVIHKSFLKLGIMCMIMTLGTTS